MPFSEITIASVPLKKLARRILISGPPNSGKTYSIATAPGRVAYVAFPGEGGATSLNLAKLTERGGRAWVWENPPAGTPTDWSRIVKDVETLTAEILAGKHGEFDTFVGDGLHKLYGAILADQTNGASETGDEFEPRAYGPAKSRFFNFVRKVRDSAIENVIFTVWEGLERDNQEDRGSSAPSHVFPNLPGQAAKQIMGEFAIVVYADVRTLGTDRKYVWQTKPAGRVWGCGLKIPAGTATVPLFIPQDLTALINLLDPREAA